MDFKNFGHYTKDEFLLMCFHLINSLDPIKLSSKKLFSNLKCFKDLNQFFQFLFLGIWTIRAFTVCLSVFPTLQ